MGARKLKSKSILKNTFHRKSNGNLISQLKILIQNQAVFETSSTNISVPKIAYSYTPSPRDGHGDGDEEDEEIFAQS